MTLQDSLLPIGVGLCLSAACGFRAFLPLLFVGAASRAGAFPLHGNYEWLASTTGLAVLLTASIAEVVAYFIPFVDNALDAIATPLALAAGALSMVVSFGGDSGAIPWALALILGAGTSGVVQAATVKTRALSSGVTAGTGNAVVADGELVGASVLSLVAVLVPLLALGLAALVIIVMVRLLRRRGKRNAERETPNA